MQTRIPLMLLLATFILPSAVWSEDSVTPPDNSVRSVDVRVWEDIDWSAMTPAEQSLWGVLGWDRASWQGEAPAPASEETAWDDLTEDEQTAARRLGYDAARWDR